jgi:hypothetical protein
MPERLLNSALLTVIVPNYFCNSSTLLFRGELPAEVAPGKSGGPKINLCMKQFERLLNAYRKPGLEGQDSLDCSDAITPRDDEHIIVLAYTHVIMAKSLLPKSLVIVLYSSILYCRCTRCPLRRKGTG